MPSPAHNETLTHIENHNELALYELIPSPVWFFDLDKHGWWWGNQAAIDFWGLSSLQALIDKDLSGDTPAARERMLQTFELAARTGLTQDPWTTYPNGKPKLLMMMHRAVLLGPERHRGIVAFINEQVELGKQPENLLLMEAMRYTRVPATTFKLDGDPLIENPAATDTYKHLNANPNAQGSNFVARFANSREGKDCLAKVQAGEEGRWDFIMRTRSGERRHSLDIRRTRHPLNGDFLFLVVEYDFTELYNALTEVEAARAKLHDIAMHDTLTGVHSLHYMQQAAKTELAHAKRHNQQRHVLFIDLDGFKTVNDQLGHDAGDAVLRKTAQRIQKEIRCEDLLARIGGDEFALLLGHDESGQDSHAVAERLLATLQNPFHLDGRQINISASIGLACYPQHGTHLEALLKAADNAMYCVKKHGKNGVALATTA